LSTLLEQTQLTMINWNKVKMLHMTVNLA